MSVLTTRLSAVLLATLLIGAIASDDAFAQGASVAPAGGVPTTTAPSNGEGTPAGGSGNVQTTRVGPSTTTASPARARRAPRRSVRRARRAVAPAN